MFLGGSGSSYIYDINHITADSTMMYRVFERENQNLTFTGAKGIANYGGKIYIKSSGDTLKTPIYHYGSSIEYTGEVPTASEALTALDAKTLKKIEGKSEIDDELDAIVSPNKLKTNKYLFEYGTWKVGRRSYSGMRVYDIETGDTVKTIQGDGDLPNTLLGSTNELIQSADGKIWFGPSVIDPETLEVTTSDFGSIVCADPKKNVVFYVPDSERKNLFRHDLDTGEETLFFTTDGLPCRSNKSEYQELNGNPAVDPHTGDVIITTMEQQAYYSYVHIVDGTTGKIKKTINMRPYRWNGPMTKIFPDKYAPEFTVSMISEISLNLTAPAKAASLASDNDASYTFDLTDAATDKDNIDSNIIFSLTDAGDAAIAVASVSGRTLSVTPVAAGDTKITLTAESNGLTVSKDIAVKVSPASGINEVVEDLDNSSSTRYSLLGQRLTTPQRGVNILRTKGGKAHKVAVK